MVRRHSHSPRRSPLTSSLRSQVVDRTGNQSNEFAIPANLPTKRERMVGASPVRLTKATWRRAIIRTQPLQRKTATEVGDMALGDGGRNRAVCRTYAAARDFQSRTFEWRQLTTVT